MFLLVLSKLEQVFQSSHKLRLLNNFLFCPKQVRNVLKIQILGQIGVALRRLEVQVVWHQVSQEVLAQHDRDLVLSIVLDVFNSLQPVADNGVAIDAYYQVLMLFKRIVHRISPVVGMGLGHEQLLYFATLDALVDVLDEAVDSSHGRH